jgi:hypothetical protein
MPEKHPTGAKTRGDVARLTYGLKPVPFTERNLPAAWKGAIQRSRFMAWVKPFRLKIEDIFAACGATPGVLARMDVLLP